ncbi:MAG: xanthine dehydrogenase family protein molybdopterin-binding subunit [Betaproteobacteria bacterium]|nr:xanthine dehydrogenase family protein molybdopterin-binding subunit [Betaproteobacteria bacterium]
MSAVVSEKKLKVVGTSPDRPEGVPKVTGQAQYGADWTLPGMLWGKILRSPHAHARIRKIDTSKALKLPGVKAVVTGADFPEQKFEYVGAARVALNFWHITRNVMAKEKALFEGHPVAAVAAASPLIAAEALKLIEVDYEVLPHVIDVEEAMKDNAPLLFEDMIPRGYTPEATKPSNISKRVDFKIGDVDAAFAQADEVIEAHFKTAPVHQGYLETHACLVRTDADGQAECWSSSQGHFAVRNLTAKITGTKVADLRCHAAEIGGGFGGKTVVYVEPVALMLSKKSGHPVKIQMNREEVFKATGPTSGASMTIKIGVMRDGKIVAAEGIFKYQAGAFPGSPVMNGCMCSFAPYDIANVRTTGYDVVCNRPKTVAYRAPGSPISAFAAESALDMAAKKIGMDPIDFRLKNIAKPGTPTVFGTKLAFNGFAETLQALKAHPAYANPPKGKNQGRGVAAGYWFNGGGESSATVSVNEDGTAVVCTGSPDIGGSRATTAQMAAETLGIEYERVRPIIADTNSVGFTQTTGGSRVTFATGMTVINACNKVIEEMCKRAAKIWKIEPENVVWEDGSARPAGKRAGEFPPLSFREIASKRTATGGPITAAASINAEGQAPGFTAQFADVEVDPETGLVKILRYVAAQDVGRAIHPKYCEGQIHGGVVQGIGWALNEEYIYDKNGRMENAGFLDYRMPVASDLPMIEAVIVEVPNPNHPYGVKGVAEANIVPPMAAIANAVQNATGKRINELPLSPPRVLAALDS